jgi:hypothetical protein
MLQLWIETIEGVAEELDQRKHLDTKRKTGFQEDALGEKEDSYYGGETEEKVSV